MDWQYYFAWTWDKVYNIPTPFPGIKYGYILLLGFFITLCSIVIRGISNGIFGHDGNTRSNVRSHKQAKKF